MALCCSGVNSPRFLSLFAGIGGFDLGLERAGFLPVGQVEINPFCQRVLAARWPGVERWDDVTTLDGEAMHQGHQAVRKEVPQEAPKIDMIVGGFP